MALTKEDLLKRISSHVNGTSDVATGDILEQWSDFLNESQDEWAYTYEPQVLIREFRTTVLQSGTSVALPDDFKEKFAGFVSVGGTKLEEFDPVEATITTGSFVTWGGNQLDGYHLTINPATYSTLSVTVPYHSRPTSLATLTSISTIPDPEFLVARTTEKILLQRGQPEYVEFQTKADTILQRLVASEVSQDLQKNKTIRTAVEYNQFVLGDD